MAESLPAPIGRFPYENARFQWPWKTKGLEFLNFCPDNSWRVDRLQSVPQLKVPAMNVTEVLKLVVEAEILTQEQADEWNSDWEQQDRSAEEGAEMIDAMVEVKLITDFQANALRDGISGPYQLGPYRVFDGLVAGRLGTIFRAVHTEFNQPVGLKVFPPGLEEDSEYALRLASETRIAIQVQHPNVLRTFHIGRAGEVVFLAIEDLSGWTLAEDLEHEPVMDPVRACRLIREAALGLEHLHSLDIVHRDIQPANIWLSNDDHVKLMEFAAARDALAAILESEESETEGQLVSLLGHRDYISVEQAANEHTVDARSDIYSLGCVFYHCLTGEVVFPDTDPVRKMARHAIEPAPHVSQINPNVPKEIGDVLATMLAKNPANRFQSAADVAWALEQVIDLEEEQLAVAQEIDTGFLSWANSYQDLQKKEDFPVVVADPNLIDFVGWLAESEDDDDKKDS